MSPKLIDALVEKVLAYGGKPAVVETTRDARDLRRLNSTSGVVSRWRVGDKYVVMRLKEGDFALKVRA